MPEPLDFWSAGQLLRAYRTGTLSPVEATRSTLSRIEALNGALNAYCRLDAEGALEAARPSEARWARGEPKGLLDGVPVSVKDVLLTRGMATLHGSRTVSADQAWVDDAPAVARLREHGAVILGKTTTAGARPQVRHGQPAHRHHAQPVEPRAQPRREQRRRGGRGGRRARSPRRRHRRRGLDPHPGDVERHRRPQADRGPRADLASLALGRALARGPAGAVRGRRRAAPHGAGPPRPARSGGPAARRPGLPCGTRGRRGRPSRSPTAPISAWPRWSRRSPPPWRARSGRSSGSGPG